MFKESLREQFDVTGRLIENLKDHDVELMQMPEKKKSKIALMTRP